MVDTPVPGLCLMVDVAFGEPYGSSSKQLRWIPYEPPGSNVDTLCVMNRHCLKLRMLNEYTESLSVIVQQDATMYSCLYFCKLLYMFRMVTPPIIRSTYNCNYSIWHWSNFGKCSVWSQLIIRVMDPSLLPSASCWTIIDIDSRCTDPWTLKNNKILSPVLCMRLSFSAHVLSSRAGSH